MIRLRVVSLTDEDRAVLEGLLNRGEILATVRRRAEILLLSNKGLSDGDISEIVPITRRAIVSIRKKYCESGLEAALYAKKRSGCPARFTAGDEAEITALACSDPPEGRVRWTLDLLKEKIGGRFKKSRIALCLKKTAASRGNGKCGVSGI
jgi:transposase